MLNKKDKYDIIDLMGYDDDWDKRIDNAVKLYIKTNQSKNRPGFKGNFIIGDEWVLTPSEYADTKDMLMQGYSDKINGYRIWAITEPERYIEWRKAYMAEYHKRPGVKKSKWLSKYRTKAKEDYTPYDLESDDVEIPDNCPILNIPLSFSDGLRGTTPALRTFDKNRGYVKGNIHVVSASANRKLSGLSFDEILEVIDKLHIEYDMWYYE